MQLICWDLEKKENIWWCILKVFRLYTFVRILCHISQTNVCFNLSVSEKASFFSIHQRSFHFHFPNHNCDEVGKSTFGKYDAVWNKYLYLPSVLCLDTDENLFSFSFLNSSICNQRYFAGFLWSLLKAVGWEDYCNSYRSSSPFMVPPLQSSSSQIAQSASSLPLLPNFVPDPTKVGRSSLF